MVRSFAFALMLAVVPGLAVAQSAKPPVNAPVVGRPISPLSSPLPPESNGLDAGGRRAPTQAEIDETEALNGKILATDQIRQAHNQAEAEGAAAAQRDYEQALAAQQAETARIAREAADAQARYDADMAAWRARADACRAGHRDQCASMGAK